MKPIITLIVYLVLFNACKSYKSSQFEAVCFTSSIFYIEGNRVLPFWQDSVQVAFYKGIYVYSIPYELKVFDVKLDADGNEINNELVKSHNDRKFFYHKLKDSVGLFFDSLNAPVGNVMPVDSLLFQYGWSKYRFLNKDTDSLYQMDENLFDGSKLQIYIPKNHKDKSTPDTTYIYSKEPTAKHKSISLIQENVNPYQIVYKIKATYNSADINFTNSKKKLKVICVFELQELGNVEAEKLMILLNRYLKSQEYLK